jgi:hypothetical protein
MHGSLRSRGVGWYLEPTETQKSQIKMDTGPNPGNIIGLGLGMIYVLNPYDLIPDAIPIIGYMDDVVVLRFMYGFGGVLWDVLT